MPSMTSLMHPTIVFATPTSMIFDLHSVQKSNATFQRLPPDIFLRFYGNARFGGNRHNLMQVLENSILDPRSRTKVSLQSES